MGSEVFELLVLIFVASLSLATVGLVDLGNNRVANLLEVLEVLLELVLLGIVVGADPVLSLLKRISDGLLVILVELVGKLLLVFNLVAHLINVVIELVLGIELLLNFFVLLGEVLGLFHHAGDVFLGEAALVVGDSDGLGFAGALLVGGNGQKGVLVDLEGNLNLGGSAGCGGDSVHVELAEVVVVLDEGTLTFEDGNGDGGLLVLVGGEGLGLLGGDNCSAGNDLGHNSSYGLNSEGQGSHIDEEDVLGSFTGLSSEDTALDGSTESDSLIGVNTSVGFLAVEEVLHELLDLGDSGRSTDEHDLINLTLLHVGVVEDLLHGLESLLEKVGAEFFESGTGDGLLEIDAVDEALDVDLDLDDGGEISLGLLNLGLQLLEGADVLLDVDSVLLLEDLAEMVGESLIEIFSAQVSVTSGGNNLEHSTVDGQEGHIESATTEIEHDDVLLASLLVHAVSDSGGGGLIDNSEHLKSGDGTGILGGQTLGVVEIGGHGDDSVLDLLGEVRLSDILHLGEDHGGDLLGREGFLAHAGHIDGDVRLATLGDDIVREPLGISLHFLVVELAADQSLNDIDGPLRVDVSLIFGGLTNKALLVVEGNVGRSNSVSLLVRDDLDAAVLENADARVRGSKIDSDDVSVDNALLLGLNLFFSEGRRSKESCR